MALQALAVCITGKIIGALGCFVLSQQAKPLVARLMYMHATYRWNRSLRPLLVVG